MGDKTKIEWTDASWNPVTGCTKVSAGCANCYAEREFHRPYPGRKFTDVQCHEDRLDIPLHWRKPRRIFVCSMGDLFHEAVPVPFIGRVLNVMSMATQHTFQILTKRPERMLQIMTAYLQCFPDALPNVWLGVSVEDREYLERIDRLKACPAAKLFVSLEPLLGPVPTLGEYLDGIDWVIAGGESGPKARPSHPDWFRGVRDQCQAAGVPFFFKQWGEWEPQNQGRPGTGIGSRLWEWDLTEEHGDCGVSFRVGKKAAGRLLDGREWNEFPMEAKRAGKGTLDTAADRP